MITASNSSENFSFFPVIMIKQAQCFKPGIPDANFLINFQKPQESNLAELAHAKGLDCRVMENKVEQGWNLVLFEH